MGQSKSIKHCKTRTFPEGTVLQFFLLKLISVLLTHSDVVLNMHDFFSTPNVKGSTDNLLLCCPVINVVLLAILHEDLSQ